MASDLERWITETNAVAAPFDIIIDDGSHHPPHQLLGLDVLFDKVTDCKKKKIVR